MSETNPQPDQQFAPAPVAKGTTAMGITGLVLGVIAVILSFIPIVNNFAIILAVIGVIFGIIGIIATKKNGKKKGRGIAIAATVLSVIALIVSFSIQAAFSSAIDSATKSNSDTSQNSGSKSDSKDSATSTDTAAGAATGAQENEGDLTSAHASITAATKSSNDYSGKPTILVTIEWTNTSDKNQMITTALNPKVYQNGQALDAAIYTSVPQGYDAEAALTELKAGANATTTLAYTLDDESTDVEVELSNLIDNGTKITRTFTLQ